jgi:hypothetical protein
MGGAIAICSYIYTIEMKNLFCTCALLLLMLISCSTAGKIINTKDYRKSKTLWVYKSMENELEDGYLLLKENHYFKFYETAGLGVNIKQSVYTGLYRQSNDTLWLNWLQVNPEQIKPFLSRKCLLDSSGQNVWFVDEVTNQKLWELRLFQGLIK